MLWEVCVWGSPLGRETFPSYVGATSRKLGGGQGEGVPMFRGVARQLSGESRGLGLQRAAAAWGLDWPGVCLVCG